MLRIVFSLFCGICHFFWFSVEFEGNSLLAEALLTVKRYYVVMECADLEL